VSSTKPLFNPEQLRHNLVKQLSSWYQQFKGGIMTTINGKLVDLMFDSDNFEGHLKIVDQPEEAQDSQLQYLQLSVSSLVGRVNELESNTLQQLQQKLEAVEKRISQRILAITVVGAIGFTGLGLWIGLSNNSSVAVRNSSNYPQLSEEHYQN
jgi:hypothetical protein